MPILLLASSLKLLGVPDLYVSIAALAAVAFAFVGWRVVRNRIKRIPAVSMPGLIRPEIPSLQSADDRLPERDADSV